MTNSFRKSYSALGSGQWLKEILKLRQATISYSTVTFLTTQDCQELVKFPAILKISPPPHCPCIERCDFTKSILNFAKVLVKKWNFFENVKRSPAGHCGG